MTFWHGARRAPALAVLIIGGGVLVPALPLPAAAALQTLSPTQDTFITLLAPHRAHGEAPTLLALGLLRARALLQFDQGAIATAVGTGTLTKAALRLHLRHTGRLFAPRERDVAVHRMTQAWTEFGATRLCPEDATIDPFAA